MAAVDSLIAEASSTGKTEDSGQLLPYDQVTVFGGRMGIGTVAPLVQSCSRGIHRWPRSRVMPERSVDAVAMEIGGLGSADDNWMNRSFSDSI